MECWDWDDDGKCDFIGSCMVETKTFGVKGQKLDIFDEKRKVAVLYP